MSDQRRDGARTFGIMAEFESPGQLLDAARIVRDEGYKKWDCYSPFPVHGLDRAMGLRDTLLPYVVLGAGLAGTAAALLMQWWMNAMDYPILISGKPLFSLPANIPIAFEVTVLFAAISAFAAMFVFNNLPKFYFPGFRSRRFRKVTTDGFFIIVESTDPLFDAERTGKLLASVGSAHVEHLED